MDALIHSWLDRTPALIDIVLIGARQAADHRAIAGANFLCDRVDRVPIARRCSWEASLHNIDLEACQLPCDLELLIFGHRAARRLLAIAQGRVENTYVIGYVRLHSITPDCRLQIANWMIRNLQFGI